MIFLIDYHRRRGTICKLQLFQDTERLETERARLALELRDSGAGHEIVVLEARSKKDLEKTHRRYFATASDLHRTAADEAAAAVASSDK